MTPEAALATVTKRLADITHAGRQNSPEAIELLAYQTVLNWMNKSGDDPGKFDRIILSISQ